MISIEGVDYAWSVPSPASLVDAGKRFAVRYGGPGSVGKQLKAAELAALRAAGLDVVANAEGAAGGFRGATAGSAWARSAAAYFGALGMPARRPIYFSVDWDAQPSDWNPIDDALRGAASVIGAGQVGVYGSYDTVAHCHSSGTAAWLWQTYAWSGSRLHPAANLYQYRNGVTIGGADLDLTRALTADYGQWGWENNMPLTKDDAALIWSYPLDVNISSDGQNLQPAGSILRYTSWEYYQLKAGVDALAKAAAMILANVQADDGDKAEIVAALAAVPGATLTALGDSTRSDHEVADALRAALGDRAARVGALLAGS